MKAIVCTKYGPPEVLKLREVRKPVPKDHEALIKVVVSTVTTGDCRIRRFDFAKWFWLPGRFLFGFTKPRKEIPGWELAGEIESVGKHVEHHKPGDVVLGFNKGVSFGGTNAEYKCLKESRLVKFDPKTISFDEAAAIPIGGLTALYFLRKAKTSKGNKVLINGASGGVGTYAVQIAKFMGAEVTGVCSKRNMELVKSLGAEHVIDYSIEDFTKNGMRYDIIFDTVDKTSFFRCRESLCENGRFLTIEWPFLLALWTSLFSKRKVIIGMAPDKREDLIYLKELVESKRVKPIIDKTYPIEDAVEAYRYVDTGRKRGNVLLIIDSERHNLLRKSFKPAL